MELISRYKRMFGQNVWNDFHFVASDEPEFSGCPDLLDMHIGSPDYLCELMNRSRRFSSIHEPTDEDFEFLGITSQNVSFVALPSKKDIKKYSGMLYFYPASFIIEPSHADYIRLSIIEPKSLRIEELSLSEIVKYTLK